MLISKKAHGTIAGVVSSRPRGRGFHNVGSVIVTGMGGLRSPFEYSVNSVIFLARDEPGKLGILL